MPRHMKPMPHEIPPSPAGQGFRITTTQADDNPPTPSEASGRVRVFVSPTRGNDLHKRYRALKKLYGQFSTWNLTRRGTRGGSNASIGKTQKTMCKVLEIEVMGRGGSHSSLHVRPLDNCALSRQSLCFFAHV